MQTILTKQVIGFGGSGILQLVNTDCNKGTMKHATGTEFVEGCETQGKHQRCRTLTWEGNISLCCSWVDGTHREEPWWTVSTYRHMRVMRQSTLSVIFLCCLYMTFIKSAFLQGKGTEFSGWVLACHIEGPGFGPQHHKQSFQIYWEGGGEWGLKFVAAICCKHREWEPLAEKEKCPFSLASCHKSSLHIQTDCKLKEMSLKITFLHVKGLASHWNKYEFLII